MSPHQSIKFSIALISKHNSNVVFALVGVHKHCPGEINFTIFLLSYRKKFACGVVTCIFLPFLVECGNGDL